MYFNSSMEWYIAIIGDIVESRKLENREEVQTRLKNVLHQINETYQTQLASKFVVTLGDEFQGLLLSGENVLDIIQQITREMYPVRIRFGIGLGEITTAINEEMSIGADGPGYYNARSAVEFLKESEKKRQMRPAHIRIEAQGDNTATTDMLNTICSLMAAVEDSWSDRQREVIWDMLKHQDGQKAVAERMEISQPSVQKNLARGDYYTYKQAMDNVEKALSEIRREDV